MFILFLYEMINKNRYLLFFNNKKFINIKFNILKVLPYLNFKKVNIIKQIIFYFIYPYKFIFNF